MRSLFALLVLGSVICFIDTVAGCPHGWTASATGATCYKFFSTPKTWAEARHACRSSGWELVTLPTSADVTFFRHYRSIIGRENTWMWIGGHKVGRYFRWDGIHQGRIIYTDWKNGEPNNAGGVENCIESHGSGEWNDTRCSFFFGYVCEKRA